MNKLTYLSILFIIILSGCKKASLIDPTPKPLVIDQYLYEGDSITDTVKGYPFDWPAQLVKLSPSAAKTPQINVAYTGDTIEWMLGQYDSQVHPYAPTKSTQNFFFFVLAGTNDAFYGRNETQIYTDLKTEWAKARADGFKVVAFTITRSIDPKRDTTLVKVNKMIKADTTKYDYLVKTDELLPDPTNTLLWQRDALHPNIAGSKMIAQEVLNVIGLKN